MDSTTDFAITFFTILALLANATTVAIAGAAATAGGDDNERSLWQTLQRELSRTTAVGLAWLVAAVSMGGSLFFSEHAGFVPCRLCWIQRGFMYPLVAVLAVATWAAHRHPGSEISRWLRRLGMAASLAGGAVALWHVLIERFPSLETGASCDPTTPCSLVWFERLGFVTLPYMSLSGFLVIFTLLAFAGRRQKHTTDQLNVPNESRV
jgi:disulfide bond formation protein DsbB